MHSARQPGSWLPHPFSNRFHALLLTMALGAFSAEAGTVDFESGGLGDWRRVAGDWQVCVENGTEPDAPGNKVLRFRDAERRGRIECAVPPDGDMVLALRVKVKSSTASWLRVHLDLDDTATGERLTLALLSHTPTIVRRRSGKSVEITDLGGTPQLSTGTWFDARVAREGDWLTGTIGSAGNPLLGNAARVFAGSFRPDRASVCVYHGQGQAEVLVDDLALGSVPPGAVPASVAAGLAVETAEARVALDSVSGCLTLTDRRSGQQWRQTIGTGSVCRVLEATAEGDTIRCRLATATGRARAEVRLEPGAEIVVTLLPDGPPCRETVEFPSALVPPQADAEWILPLGEGVRVRADRVGAHGLLGAHTWSQRALIMPWFGLIQGEGGAMVLVETPDDFVLGLREATPAETKGTAPVVCATNQWLPQGDRLGYPRRLRYCLFDHGGYVAMARRYRRYLMDQGRFRTLKDKAQRLPQVSALLGAIDIIDVSPKGEEVIDWMVAGGIRHALYTVHWHSTPLDDGAVPRLAKAQQAGYVTSRFDGYFDIYTPELRALRGGAPHAKAQLTTGYPEEAVVTAEGQPMPGWPHPVGRERLPDGSTRVRTVAGARRCTLCMEHWMRQEIAADAVRFGHGARFIDVTTANPLWECFSPAHPMTRTADREQRRGFFRYLSGLGLASGSEGGADWANDLLVWQEGSLTLPRVASWGGIYPSGKPLTMPTDYAHTQFDPGLRLPLRELVYHDSTLITWRWEQTPQRLGDEKLWRLWDLFHILYAQMPIFVIHTAETETWSDATRKRMLTTYRDVCGWLEKVAGSAMVDHRCLTDDRTVQRTRFANGWSATVNFSSDRAWSAPDGTVLPPLGLAVQPPE